MASSRTRGRSRSTWPRANARRRARSRVWSGGSFSIIWLRCSRLNGSSRQRGSRSVHSRRTGGPEHRVHAGVVEDQPHPPGSYQATGCCSRSSAKNG